jgi:1,4-alpha-glucan branching enzyme
MTYQYQWEQFIKDNKPKKDIIRWNSPFGPQVISRKKSKAEKIKIQLLIDNPKIQAYLVGNFNDWGKKNIDLYEFKHDKESIFASIETTELRHKDPYKILLIEDNQKLYLQDPATAYFDDEGNSIFWDYEDPSCYKRRYNFINTIERSTKILQTDLPGLIVHWKDKKGIIGHSIEQKKYFTFITESGVLEHIRDLGFNTIQFLPFAQSIDGDNWKFRYLVPFQFAIQKNWGTPDDFTRMIDKCHELGIAVIGDFVIGHLPHKDFFIFGKSSLQNGIHLWKNRHGTQLYMKEETNWGTMRIDIDNKYVREFIQASCLHYMKRYGIDGFRIDNVDGILRYGQNGDGEERPNGRIYLRDLIKIIYAYNPYALIHLEAHYFHEDNAKMLVVPQESDSRALGATAYNSSRITYYLHTEFMPKDVKNVSPWKFKHINEEKEWGQSNSTVADFHNHDAAAGLMEMRCTGSYAYDTMTHKQPLNHIHAIGKIKVMEAIISFCCEGRTLDLLQTFLLQTGTFEHDSSIQWFLTYNQANKNTVAFKQKINEIMDDPAFWPMFTKNRKILNLDENNKILVIERSALHNRKKSKYIIIINLSGWRHQNYKVGLDNKNDFEVIFNSDLFDYSGFGMISYPDVLKNTESINFELLDREIELSIIAPYGIIVLKEL